MGERERERERARKSERASKCERELAVCIKLTVHALIFMFNLVLCVFLFLPSPCYSLKEWKLIITCTIRYDI